MRHISSLTPVQIEKGEKSYLPVERLRESLMGDVVYCNSHSEQRDRIVR